MSLWRTDEPPIEEPMFAIVETNGGSRYFIGQIDQQGTLVDLDYGDDYGWESDCIDRWCPLDHVIEAIENCSDTSDDPSQGEKEE